MKPKLSRILLFGMLVNAAVAPQVYAAGGTDITRSTAYALGLLGLTVIGLAIYLSVVIVQPEKF